MQATDVKIKTWEGYIPLAAGSALGAAGAASLGAGGAPLELSEGAGLLGAGGAAAGGGGCTGAGAAGAGGAAGGAAAAAGVKPAPGLKFPAVGLKLKLPAVGFNVVLGGAGLYITSSSSRCSQESAIVCRSCNMLNKPRRCREHLLKPPQLAKKKMMFEKLVILSHISHYICFYLVKNILIYAKLHAIGVI
jgi:hypothetical protein